MGKNLIIGYDSEAEQRTKHNEFMRAETLSKAVEYFNRYKLPVSVSKLQKEGFVNYLRRVFSETYTGKYPEHLAVDERIKISQIDIKPLEDLQSDFNRYQDNRTDFNIYATTDHEKAKYKSAVNLLEAWQNFIEVNGNTINKSNAETALSDLTRMALIKKNGKLSVNLYHYVLNNDFK